jgi:hypothetical protein
MVKVSEIAQKLALAQFELYPGCSDEKQYAVYVLIRDLYGQKRLTVAEKAQMRPFVRHGPSSVEKLEERYRVAHPNAGGTKETVPKDPLPMGRFLWRQVREQLPALVENPYVRTAVRLVYRNARERVVTTLQELQYGTPTAVEVDAMLVECMLQDNHGGVGEMV